MVSLSKLGDLLLLLLLLWLFYYYFLTPAELTHSVLLVAGVQYCDSTMPPFT